MDITFPFFESSAEIRLCFAMAPLCRYTFPRRNDKFKTKHKAPTVFPFSHFTYSVDGKFILWEFSAGIVHYASAHCSFT